jgi:hypothetical protein
VPFLKFSSSKKIFFIIFTASSEENTPSESVVILPSFLPSKVKNTSVLSPSPHSKPNLPLKYTTSFIAAAISFNTLSLPSVVDS